VLATAWIALWLLAGSSDPAPDVVADGLAVRPSGRVSVDVTSVPASPQPGEPFTLSVEVTPRTGIRVYARDNPGYFPITVAFEWPRGLKADPPQYPIAEPYLFGPLKELVQVYREPFRITQRVTVRPRSPSARPGSLSIAGLLRYQSCDDRVCFPVESLPVRITVAVQAAGAGTGSAK
jgi:hypothetical protein